MTQKDRDGHRASRIKKRDSVFAQAMVAYGIMAALALIAILVQRNVDPSRAYILPILANTFAPTTITFLATGLFEIDAISQTKITTSFYVFVTVAISLFYAGFTCMDALEDGPVVKFAFLSAACALLALIILLVHVSAFAGGDREKRPKTSDGSISGKKV